MSDMVERVGKAIETALLEELTMNAVARTAMKTMWEPTEAMLSAFGEEYATRSLALNTWHAMIDAALEADK